MNKTLLLFSNIWRLSKTSQFTWMHNYWATEAGVVRDYFGRPSRDCVQAYAYQSYRDSRFWRRLAWITIQNCREVELLSQSEKDPYLFVGTSLFLFISWLRVYATLSNLHRNEGSMHININASLLNEFSMLVQWITSPANNEDYEEKFTYEIGLT